MAVRHRLAELLAERGYGAQADLARAIGEHRNRVNNWVRGTTDIRADDVPRIAKALGVTIAALYGEEERGGAPGDRASDHPGRIARRVATQLLADEDLTELLDSMGRDLDLLRQRLVSQETAPLESPTTATSED